MTGVSLRLLGGLVKAWGRTKRPFGGGAGIQTCGHGCAQVYGGSRSDGGRFLYYLRGRPSFWAYAGLAGWRTCLAGLLGRPGLGLGYIGYGGELRTLAQISPFKETCAFGCIGIWSRMKFPSTPRGTGCQRRAFQGLALRLFPVVSLFAPACIAVRRVRFLAAFAK